MKKTPSYIRANTVVPDATKLLYFNMCLQIAFQKEEQSTKDQMSVTVVLFILTFGLIMTLSS